MQLFDKHASLIVSQSCVDRHLACPPLSHFSVHKPSWMLKLLRVSWQSTRSTTPTSLCAATPQLMTSLMWWREIGKLLKCQNGLSLVISNGCGLLGSSIPFKFPPHQCRKCSLCVVWGSNHPCIFRPLDVATV